MELEVESGVYDDQLAEFILRLQGEPNEEIPMELEALHSIYGPHSIRLWDSSRSNTHNSGTNTPAAGRQPLPKLEWAPGDRIRFEILIPLLSPFEDIKVRILVTLPDAYPSRSPPQLQLLTRYIGAYSVDSTIFGVVLRTFIAHPNMEWKHGDVAVFDGLEAAKTDLTAWYSEKLSEGTVGELRREDERDLKHGNHTPVPSAPGHAGDPPARESPMLQLPEGIHLAESDPILDRKSVFVGRACRITDPSQVAGVLAYLMADRKIARAAHPIINAWRCSANGVMHQDNDDDGETAAGGRLAHLLQILVRGFLALSRGISFELKFQDLDHVLVVVTRYFGGIHLGPDRFKHINAAGRSAMEAAGLLNDDPNGAKKGKNVSKKKAS